MQLASATCGANWFISFIRCTIGLSGLACCRCIFGLYFLWFFFFAIKSTPASFPYIF
jgi:hypothetical protein